MIELIVAGMSTVLFWLLMYICSMFVMWYLMGVIEFEIDWDLLPVWILITFISPLVCIWCICVICYRNGLKYKDVKAERTRARVERQGAMSDEQLERLGMR